MKTVVLGPRPPELEELIERRRALGLDGYDETWEGVYHVAPMARPDHARVQAVLLVLLEPYAHSAGLLTYGPFNLGEPDDFRVPDGGFFRSPASETYVPTAAIVIEVVSPDDETYEKFDFYTRHGVDELIVADPTKRSLRCFRLEGEGYLEAEGSDLLGVAAAELAGRISWP